MKRVFGLDLVRACAILLVLFSHSSNIIVPYVPLLKNIGVCGFLGVELFFVLSGFLIGSILIGIFFKKERFNLESLLKFWKRRWFRTLPNYYLFLTFNIALLLVAGSIAIDWKYFLFVQNVLHSSSNFFGESWSLAVEEWFYFSFPLLLLFFSLLFKKVEKSKLFILSALVMLILVTMFRIIYVYFYSPGWEVGVRKILLLRLDSIMYGVILAYLKYVIPEFLQKYRVKLFAIGMVIVGVVVYQFYYFAEDLDSFYLKTLYFNLVSLGLVCLLPLMDNFSSYRNKFSTYITFVSLVSYSVYLLHNSILLVLFMKFLTPDSFAEALIYYVLYWIFALLLSGITYKVIEKPVMKLRDKAHVRQSIKSILWGQRKNEAVTAKGE